MNLNSKNRKTAYLIFYGILVLLLIREYSYVHPFNPGYGLLGPRWTYTSTRTFTWWFLLVCSLIMIIPLFYKQKIGLLGLLLFTSVFIRPYIQYKYPEQTALDLLNENQQEFNQLITKNKIISDSTLITDLHVYQFEQLVVKDSVYYFLCMSEFPFGICYSKSTNLPKENFDTTLKYKPIKKNWYEFE